MATRHNTCINPALANDASGWGGGSTPTRTAVTGFLRSWAARYTSDGAIVTARGAAVAGQTYTASMYVRDVIGWGGTCWIEWLDASLNTVTFTAGSFSLTAGTVTRVSVTATAPANTAWARLVLEDMREGSLSNTADCSCLLVEQSSSVEDYFDGDTSPGGSWDGTPGSSASTLTDTPAVTGDLTGTLPALSAALTADVQDPATLAGTLPALTGSLSAAALTSGDLAGTLPALTGELSATATITGSLAGVLPAPAASLTGTVPAQGPLAGTLPALTGAFSGSATATGSISGTLPALTGSLVGIQPDLIRAIRVVPGELARSTALAGDVSGPDVQREVSGPATRRIVTGIGV